jgi:hypothetical protein
MKKDLIYLGIIGILCVAIYYLWNKSSDFKYNYLKKERNIQSLKDTIIQEKNRFNEIYYTNNLLINDKEELQQLNNDLFVELEKQRGKIAYLQSSIFSISTKKPKIDTTYIIANSDKNPCDTSVNYVVSWDFSQTFDKDNFRILKGKTQFNINQGILGQAESFVEEDKINFNLITGIEKKNEDYQIFVKSNYPGLIPSQIEGSFIPQKDLCPPPKKLKYSFGPIVNIGIGSSLNSFNVMPYVGVGVGFHYSWVRF